ncbi:MAG TPA: hypothetical protein VM098_01050 [Phycisphaerae bacterium]|nr:hypothetical protein [Phycisphaerae bacterium]
MRKAAKLILMSLFAASLPAAVLLAPPRPDDEMVPIQTQLELKQKLLEKMGGKSKLAELLAHVQREWESLTPDQRHQFRQKALAFLGKNDEQAGKLLEHYEKLIKMTVSQREEYRQRGAWLSAVVKWLEDNDPERIEKLKAMRPRDRAQELVALRDRLVKEKKIALEAATQPAEEPESPSSRPGSPTSREAVKQ